MTRARTPRLAKRASGSLVHLRPDQSLKRCGGLSGFHLGKAKLPTPQPFGRLGLLRLVGLDAPLSSAPMAALPTSGDTLASPSDMTTTLNSGI
jgi:hypothetical protein